MLTAFTTNIDDNGPLSDLLPAISNIGIHLTDMHVSPQAPYHGIFRADQAGQPVACARASVTDRCGRVRDVDVYGSAAQLRLLAQALLEAADAVDPQAMRSRAEAPGGWRAYRRAQAALSADESNLVQAEVQA